MVVGVFTDEGWEGERRKIYLPITTAQKIFSGDDRIHELLATSNSSDLEETLLMKQRLRASLGEKHNFDKEDMQAIYVWNNFENFQDFQTFFGMLKGFLWFVVVQKVI